MPEPPSPKKTAQEKEFAALQLRNLKRIATLGVGGFGRVELVVAFDYTLNFLSPHFLFVTFLLSFVSWPQICSLPKILAIEFSRC